MDGREADFGSLHELIGRKVSFRGGRGTIVEILEDGPSLVIQVEDLEIQPDSFGYARRRSRETRLVEVFDQAGRYDPEFLALVVEE